MHFARDIDLIGGPVLSEKGTGLLAVSDLSVKRHSRVAVCCVGPSNVSQEGLSVPTVY